VAMPIQGCGAARNRTRFGGVGFLTTSGSESDIWSDSGSPIVSPLHHTPKLGIPVELVQFVKKLLLKQIILLCTTISTEC